MTQFNLGYRIEAKDATRSTLASALGGVTRFARLASKPITIPLRVGRKGLSLLRDINLGLRPLVGAIDNIIDRGARLEVVSKSFQSLTGKNAAQARRLAKELVQAASGTVKLSKAMTIANRALGSGIDVSQLKTAVEFISKKAITTGKNAEQSLEKVITGLSRGTPLFLDDFGILVDGIPGVARDFDKIAGSGAFDSLGPAARKAELIRQAIAEMNQQMGKIGVTGNETIFIFQGIKNQIGDIVDRLVGSVARSKALNESLKGIRDTLSGITEFLEGGGSFLDILFGKKGGQSSGLFGVIKAGLLDVAEAFGRAILVNLLKGFITVLDLVSGVNIFEASFKLLEASLKTLNVKDLFKDVKLFDVVTKSLGAVAKSIDALNDSIPTFVEEMGGLVDSITSLPKPGDKGSGVPGLAGGATKLDAADLLATGGKAAVSNLPGVVSEQVTKAVGTVGVAKGAGLASRGLAKIIAKNASTEIRVAAATRLAGQFASAAPAGAPLLQTGALASLKFVAKKAIPVATIADFGFSLFTFGKELVGLNDALDDAEQAIEDEKFAFRRLEKSRREKAERDAKKKADNKPLLPDKPEVFFPAAPSRGLGPQASAGAGPVGGSLPVVLAGLLPGLVLGATPPATTQPAGSKPGAIDRLKKALEKLEAAGGGESRGSKELSLFLKDFPPRAAKSKPDAQVGNGLKFPELSRLGKRRLLNEDARLKMEKTVIDNRARREAKLFAANKARELRKSGRRVDKAGEARLFEDRFLDLTLFGRNEDIEERRAEIVRLLKDSSEAKSNRIDELRKTRKDRTLRREERAERIQRALPWSEIIQDNKESSERIEGSIATLVDSIDRGIAALVGEERKIANAGGRRT